MHEYAVPMVPPPPTQRVLTTVNSWVATAPHPRVGRSAANDTARDCAPGENTLLAG